MVECVRKEKIRKEGYDKVLSPALQLAVSVG